MITAIVLNKSDANSQLHPVYEAFQLFHQAICYEALGSAAHSYSRNKIPLLNSAKEKFEAALGALPPPFASGETAQYDTPKSSPLDLNFPAAKSPRHSMSQNSTVVTLPAFVDGVSTSDACEESPPTAFVPSIQFSSRTRTPSEASSHYSSSTSSSVSDVYTVPDFDRYSPRSDFLITSAAIPRTITYPDVRKQGEINSGKNHDSGSDTEPTPRKPSYRNRLSACLSSTHVLADNLVPSPLFSRTKKTGQIAYLASGNNDIPMGDEGACATAQPPRPIPHTPYTHRTDHTLLPQRRTAVQTLISKFEQTLPFPNTPSSYTTATHSVSVFTPDTQMLITPATARFAAIASIFTTHSLEHQIDIRSPELRLSEYLSSQSLARYNACLSSFRTSLHASISRIETLIDEGHELQERHVKEKQEAILRNSQKTGGIGQVRLRSYWLLSTPATTSFPAPQSSTISKAANSGAARERLRTCGGNGLPDASSLSPIGAETLTVTPSTTSSTPTILPTKSKTRFIDRLPEFRPSEENTRKRERIDRLRASGFRVRKETYGWKGARYYEDVRRRVEMELRG